MNSVYTNNLAHRYLLTKGAQQVTSATLTKQWVMGVRRAWLQLLKPQIQTWDDVQRAITQCQTFVQNLQDEIFYTRRGPYTGTPIMTEGGKVKKLLDQLDEALSDARSAATHWENVYEGKSLPGFSREQAEQSRLAWANDFEDALSAGVVGSITKILDKALKLLREDALRIKEHDEQFPDDPFTRSVTYKQFDLSGVKVIVKDAKVLPGQIEEYMRRLSEAHQLLKKKGFGKVWYGEIFIDCEKCGGENQYGNELGVGGHYKIGPNTVSIYTRPGKYVTELLIHELGHRWWFKHMKRENRLRFEDWITSGLVPVSVYGGKHHQEAYAEAFAWYVLDRNMTSQQVETFKLVSFGRRFSASQRVASRYLARRFTAEYSETTLDEIMAGVGMLLAQSVIVSNEFFSEGEIRKYLQLRRSYHETFTEACEDLAEEITAGQFGSAAMQAVRPLEQIGAIPAKQAQKALRAAAKLLRRLKPLMRDLEGDPKLRRLVYLASALVSKDAYDTYYKELLNSLVRVKSVPAPVRTLLRKALKLMPQTQKFTEASNPGAWFEMAPKQKATISKALKDAELELTEIYEKYKDDPEARQEAWALVQRRINRLKSAAGVNKAIIEKGDAKKLPSLDAILKKESKNLPDGPTEYIIKKIEAQIREVYSKKGKLPRNVGKVLTQIKKARNFDTIRRILAEAQEQKVAFLVEDVEPFLQQASKNIAVQRGIALTPIQWDPITPEEFKEKHGTGRVYFDSEVYTPEQQKEVLGRVSRAMGDLEGVFGKGFAGKHEKPLDFKFEGNLGLASASYFGWDDRNNWQPRVKFGEDYGGLLAHELSHFFDDMLYAKINKAKDPEGYEKNKAKYGPGSGTLFVNTGVDLEYQGKKPAYGSDVIPELDEFIQTVLATPDFKRWKDMTGSPHDISNVEKAVKNLTGMSAYDLPKDHPYKPYIFDPPRFKSKWPPELLEATEAIYKDSMDGDDRKLNYYNSGVEVWARMVEQYVATKLADAGISNPWLTQLTYDTETLPQMMEQDTFEEKIVPILDRMFAHIKERNLVARYLASRAY